MPLPGEPLEKLGFLTIGSFDGADPGPGHETTLRVIALGEELGFDSAWVRHRHLQHGISSPVAVLAAATQRTRRIALGTAVIPLGWENPLRLAGFRLVREVVFVLPFGFAPEDYVQILTDIATRLGPALGRRPTAS